MIAIVVASRDVAANGDPVRTKTTSSFDETANQLADEVLASEDFWWKRTARIESPSSIGGIFSALYRWLIEPVLNLLKAILEWFSSLSGIKTQGNWSSGIPFLRLLVAVLTALVIWRVIVKLRQSPVTKSSIAHDSGAVQLLRPVALLDEAQQALTAGDHRAAIRFAFLALIAHLQDRGNLVYDPSRSNREYQRDLRQWPDVIAVFSACAEPFERCWYGGRQLELAEVELAISRCREQLFATGEA